ncbi:nucleoside triphosphate pyrophosphohydrolase [PinkBerry-associated phage LS06-2018-MD08]|nr:nucleoside triphosphate pyrophosphohydrolase [PinkBerry-associated phage LS06-2018-MD08]
MGYSNDPVVIQDKLIEELRELINEIIIPTSTSNLRKEMADCVIMIQAYCELKGWTMEDIIDYGIAINESRMVKLKRRY